MAQEEFEIEISPNGKVQVRTKGIKGAQCLDYADLFVQIIGREESRELTSEYHEGNVEIKHHVQQKQRR